MIGYQKEGPLTGEVAAQMSAQDQELMQMALRDRAQRAQSVPQPVAARPRPTLQELARRSEVQSSGCSELKMRLEALLGRLQGEGPEDKSVLCAGGPLSTSPLEIIHQRQEFSLDEINICRSLISQINELLFDEQG